MKNNEGMIELLKSQDLLRKDLGMPSLFQYQSVRLFLLDTLATKQKNNPGFSLRQWALKMGWKSHTLLALLLQGKRPIRLKHTEFLTKGLSLSPQEMLYLKALIQFESANTPEEKKLCQIWLADLSPEGEFKSREIDEYSIIAHWIHMAILSMTSLKNFKGTAEEVQKKLGKKVTMPQIRSAIHRLVDHGLCAYDEKGKLIATQQRVSTKNDVSSAGVREYHKQVNDLAKSAIDEQSILEREFQSFAIAIDKEDIPFAKELIRKFRFQFAKALGAKVNEANAVYQMNLQFFNLLDEDVQRGLKHEK